MTTKGMIAGNTGSRFSESDSETPSRMMKTMGIALRKGKTDQMATKQGLYFDVVENNSVWLRFGFGSCADMSSFLVKLVRQEWTI